MKRAAICVGVDRTASMTPLQAAAKGARDFGAWATSQGCDTTVLVDDPSSVTASAVFAAVRQAVQGNYGQLIVYFSGHGILGAPGAEFWLLSDAPDNPNEAINLFRSVEDARNCGIPHVVFISDACRSSVAGPPLSGVTGSVIFPSRQPGQVRAEVDVFYATRPGDPAYEVPEVEATARYKGVFTECLLGVLAAPTDDLVDAVADGASLLNVITSRKLKPQLESLVPAAAGSVDIKLRQIPELRVETALPKYFARIDGAVAVRPGPIAGGTPPPPRTFETALDALSSLHFARAAAPGDAGNHALAAELGLPGEVQRLAAARGRGHFETRTGFSVHGAIPRAVFARDWHADPPFQEQEQAWHLRLHPGSETIRKPGSVLIELEGGTATVVAILPGFIGTIVVDHDRVVNVSYIPSDQTPLYGPYQARAADLDRMRAFLAVAARNGQFVVEPGSAANLADRIRQDKNLDPTMGIYAAYAYAQVGRFEDVYSVFEYMRDSPDPWYDPGAAVPFDVVLLASRSRKFSAADARARHAPFGPMLAQGWALLDEADQCWQPIHTRVRPHLLPALWTTFSASVVPVLQAALERGDVE